MKAVVILMCLLGTAFSVPIQQMQQKIQAQQPQPGMQSYPSINLEVMQDIAYYKRFKQKHPQAAPAVGNVPAAPQAPVQPGQPGDQPEHQTQKHFKVCK
ncbi:UNVERIFIED_CONTAM: hypothetical protein FKN15_034944 [Acipenser sinensis]